MHIDAALLEILTMVHSTWEDGDIYVHCTFESPQILQRALSDVFFGRVLVLHLPAKPQVQAIKPLLSLPSVRTCTELWLFGPKGKMDQQNFHLSVKDMTDWLHQNAKPGVRRKLRTRDYLPARVTFDLQTLISSLLEVRSAATPKRPT